MPFMIESISTAKPVMETKLCSLVLRVRSFSSSGFLRVLPGDILFTNDSPLDSQDARLRRMVCNDIISHTLKHKEFTELEGRLAAIEDRLADRP